MYSAEINLHKYTVSEAMDVFLKYYNQYAGNIEQIKVIHGYGSSGNGGRIRTRLRALLKNYPDRVAFHRGESISNNPGYTLVFPHNTLPSALDILGIEILEYCTIPKTKKKIAGKFRKYGDSKILSTLKFLEKQAKLTVKWKGRHKCYVVKDD
ncbi:Protein containing Smr protein/MutS2 [Candidatus Magnetomoraceae bacterium gMMP-15]